MRVYGGTSREVIKLASYQQGETDKREPDAIDPSVRRRIADDDGRGVVVHELVGGWEPLARRRPDRSNELLVLRIKAVDAHPEPPARAPVTGQSSRAAPNGRLFVGRPSLSP
jgi:hypothetical protein